MGLFNKDSDSAHSGSRGEVEISVPQEDTSETRLKKEVDSKLETSPGSGDVTLEDVYSQNKRIIELLEQIKGGSRLKKEVENDQDIKGGMDELL